MRYYRQFPYVSAKEVTASLLFAIALVAISCETVFAAAPEVRTDFATAVYDDRAVLNGYVDPNEQSDTTHWFEWGLSSSLGNVTARRWHGINSANYSWFVQNLLPQRTYYFRAVAEYSGGTIRGEIRTFTTLPGSQGSGPEVRTESATAVTLTSSGLRGFIDPKGRSGVTGWFEWGGTTALGNSTGVENHSSSASSFTAFISGLQPGTTYYYRALAEQGGQRVIGATLNFRTQGTAPIPLSPQPSPTPQPVPTPTPTPGTPVTVPTVITKLATGIGDTSTLLNGSVSSVSAAATESWFEWGPTPALGRLTQRRNHGFVQGAEFSVALSGLAPNTVYYFRAVAENPAGRAFGSVFSFRTSPSQFPRTIATVGVALLPKPSGAVVSGRRSILLEKRVENETLPNCEVTNCIVAVSGHKVRYTLTAENSGTVTLEDAIITDTLSKHLEFIVASAGGTYDAVRHEIRWILGDLEPRASRAVTVELRARAVSELTTATNVATVTAGGVTKSSNGTEVRIYPLERTEDIVAGGGTSTQNSIMPELLPVTGTAATASAGSSVTGWAVIAALILLATWIGFQIRRQIRQKQRMRISSGVTEITNEEF